MYPSLTVGPLSLPTSQFLALIAAWIGLTVMAQTGARRGLDSDHLWNIGTIAIITGVIVARLWHVVQFWGVYRTEPLLALSPRPGGLALWPGIVGALAGAYVYLIRRRLDPVAVAAAAVVGVLVGGAVLEVSAFLTGTTVGTLSRLPWALPLFDETRHPVALYRALGMTILAIALFAGTTAHKDRKVVLLAGLGYALIRLFSDAFLADGDAVAGFRLSQVIALAAALVFTLLLARSRERDSG